MPLNGLLSCFRRKQTDSSEYNAFPLMRRLTKETIIYAPNILRSGINFRELVRLPEEESLSNWIALHGPRYEYRWADGETFKKPTPLPAPKYIEYLMDWTESQINNENVFPVTTDVPFPKSFINLCRKILTRLFRVFVHVYIHHFDRIVSIGAEDHVNTCYKHFYYFVQEFKLISAREIGPLTEVTARVCGN